MAINFFTPIAVGWETTLACNMRCKHCGSIAGTKRAEELTTDEAIALCRQFDAFPQAHITLTGGETLVRKDWPQIVEELVRRRGACGIISNGWSIDRDVARLLKHIQGKRGRINIGLSLDGDETRHDDLRAKPGSYQRVIEALRNLREQGIATSIITCMHPGNVAHLDHVRDVALEYGAYAWQIQVTAEFGRAADNSGLILQRSHYRTIAKKIAGYRKELRHSPLGVYTADCVGYMGALETSLRTCHWHGCHAGIRCLGIQSNGNVKGCLSLLEDVFIEGNVRQRPIGEIWADPERFGYNRQFTPDQLTGPCARCKYGYACRAGCHSTSYSMLGTVYEAPYCLYAEEQGWFDAAAAATPGLPPAPGGDPSLPREPEVVSLF